MSITFIPVYVLFREDLWRTFFCRLKMSSY